MANIENFFTGGEEYFIKYENGTHVIKRVDFEENTIIFTGNYEKCLGYKKVLFEDNFEYDLNL